MTCSAASRRAAAALGCCLCAWLVACAGASPCPPSPPRPTGAPFVFSVWREADPQDAPPRLTLVGTWHLAGQADVPDVVWQRLAGARVFYSELDGEGATDVLLPRGPGLDQQLSEDRWYELVRLLTGVVTPERLARLKPWVAMSLLSARAGQAPSPTLDEALLARAESLDLDHRALETPAEQVAALDRVLGLPALEEALADTSVMACRLADDLDAYRHGDDALATPSAQDPTYVVLIAERNARWLPALVAALGGDAPTVVAVGVMHLFGPAGLVPMLEASGFRVARVAVSR